MSALLRLVLVAGGVLSKSLATASLHKVSAEAREANKHIQLLEQEAGLSQRTPSSM